MVMVIIRGSDSGVEMVAARANKLAFSLGGVSFRHTRDFGPPEAKNRPFLAPRGGGNLPLLGPQRKPGSPAGGAKGDVFRPSERPIQARRYSSKKKYCIIPCGYCAV